MWGGKGGIGSKCLALSCSAGIRLGPVFYSYITPGVKSELGASHTGSFFQSELRVKHL